jgi:secreted protein with Ig-like and vWFA domain
MAAPTQIVITYTGGSGSPQTITLPKPSTGVPMDYTLFVRNAFSAGGFWYVSSGGVNTFVPWNQVTAITAQ